MVQEILNPLEAPLWDRMRILLKGCRAFGVVVEYT